MLPALREELALYPGPAAASGAPSWSLLDPVRNLFFRIDWLTFEILSRWHLDDADRIADSVRRETPIDAETTDVEEVLRFLGEQELIVRHSAEDAAWLSRQSKQRTPTRWQWLLHHYLFFRVPLWRPDRWLARTAWLAAPFFSTGFLVATLAALVAGLVAVSQQWGTFTATLLDTFSWQGLLGYGLTLALVKLLHEFGHAYTAKRFGCRVPTMGVAFLVLFPMAYTDVNEAWKLAGRRQRLAVGAAGILTELAIAAWATLAWAMLPDGFLRSAAFLLATTTWISTLLINASPFMRFDGYFLLMDWLDLPNLHQRAFDLARWRLRELLFRLRAAVPEHFSRKREAGLILFGYATWVYRLLVFSGIAVLVYYAVPKPLGPFLAGIEIVYFIALPVWREMKAWRPMLPAILRSPRSLLTLLVLAGGAAAVLLPWDQRVHSQGLLRPAQQFPLVAPGPGVIAALPVANGAAVQTGTLLIALHAPDLVYQKQAAAARAAGLRWQASAAGVDNKLRQQQQVIGAARAKVGSELHSIAEEQARYALKAPFAGRLFFINPDLQPGTWAGKNERLAVLADVARWKVETYLPEAELHRVRVNDDAQFMSETPDAARLALRVTQIDRDAAHVLPDGMLSSTRGGALLAREKGRQIVPEQALYRVVLEPVAPYAGDQPQVLRGSVIIDGEAKAWAEDFMRSAAAFLVRESGF